MLESRKQQRNDKSGGGGSKMVVGSRRLCWKVRRGVSAWEMASVHVELMWEIEQCFRNVENQPLTVGSKIIRQ